MEASQVVQVLTPGGHLVGCLPIPQEEMSNIQPFCPQCCNVYVNQVETWHQHQPIELECGHVFCLTCVIQRVDLAMDAALACRHCNRTIGGLGSGLEFGWDELFRQLEAVRALQGLKKADSGDSHVALDSGLDALNAQRNTDYSLSDLDNALQNLNLQQGTATSTEDVLEHLKGLDLSSS